MDSYPGACSAIIILLSLPICYGFMLDGAPAANNVTACADKSEECRLLNDSINICSNPGEARVMCPKFCNMCPVDGAWTSWTNWTRCDVTCGSGTQTRHRTCTNPAPANGGAVCIGNQTEQSTCYFDTCPVPGGWGGWSSWGECSQTCGTGLSRRDRYCNNPYPQSGGDYCFGEGIGYQICTVSTCSVRGGWGDWSGWGACSVTCGTGIKRRERQCDSPTPTVYADRCLGDYTEFTTCILQSCSPHGGWSGWTAWTSCSVTCGFGIKRRERQCNNPAPSSYALRCPGDDSEYNTCVQPSCYRNVKSAFFATNIVTSSVSHQQTILQWTFSHYFARFTTVLLNDGGYYSSTTGKFTCHIPGIYSFSVTLTENTNHTSSQFCNIYVNGGMKMSLTTHTESYDQNRLSVSASPVLHLNRNDQVYIAHCDTSSYFDHPACSFSGVLIKPDE